MAIKAQIESGQSVDIVSIRSSQPKEAKFSRSYQFKRHSRTSIGPGCRAERPDFKKVYITLKPGQELTAFTELTSSPGW